MKYLIIIITIGFLMTISHTIALSEDNNPLLKKYDTPFGVPPFDKIKNEHFLPAFQEAIKQHDKEIENIVNNKKAPDFQNTIEALEYSGELLNDVSTIFYNINSANTNKEIQTIAKEVAPELSKHGDNITLNKKLFERIKKVYNQKNKLNLNQEQKQLLEETYKSFARNGANLNAKKQTELRKINEQLSVLTLKFGENVLNETNSFKLAIDRVENLSGLPQSLIDAAAEAAKNAGMSNKWVFTLQNPSIMPFLQYSTERNLREKMVNAYINRGNNNDDKDNKKIITDIVNLRLERAKLLGYDTYADFTLEETMAKKPANVYKLLNQLWEPALKVAKKEAKDLQALIDKEGGKFKLQPWDWRFYAEKLRKEKYDLDEEELRPYFKLDNVKQGIFTLVNKLYGLTFKELNNIPVYHPDAKAYEVKNSDGSHLGILYMDFHPRESKRGGAWMTNYREQYKKDGKMISPVVSLVCNFSKPTADTPALLTLDEVETFFHEFGHCLHGLLSNCTYRSIAGTNVPRDFVELPSQIMENWVTEPEVLAFYAKHYKTGEMMPKELIEKLQKSALFNQGFATVEFLAAALLDMSYYTIKDKLTTDITSFEKKELDKIGLIPEIVVRYRSTYFQHIFSGGYSSGYYSYIWSGVLDTDAFEAFKENGLFDKKTAQSFRDNILSKGKTDDPMNLYVKFRGREPKIEPLLKKRGLLEK